MWICHKFHMDWSEAAYELFRIWLLIGQRLIWICQKLHVNLSEAVLYWFNSEKILFLAFNFCQDHYEKNVSPNWPTGSIQSSSRDVRPFSPCPLPMWFSQGIKGGSRVAKPFPTVASVPWKNVTLNYLPSEYMFRSRHQLWHQYLEKC